MRHRPTAPAKPVTVLPVHLWRVHLHLAEKELQHIRRFLHQSHSLIHVFWPKYNFAFTEEAKPRNNWMHRSGIHSFFFAHSFSFAAR
jgi:hypothetical protein